MIRILIMMAVCCVPILLLPQDWPWYVRLPLGLAWGVLLGRFFYRIGWRLPDY